MTTSLKVGVIFIIISVFYHTTAQESPVIKTNVTVTTEEAPKELSDGRRTEKYAYHHQLIAFTVLSVVGVVLLIQLVSWSLYYAKSKRGANLHSLLDDFDEGRVDSV